MGVGGMRLNDRYREAKIKLLDWSNYSRLLITADEDEKARLLENKKFIDGLLANIPCYERNVIYLRYTKNLTVLGVSLQSYYSIRQVHRILKKFYKKVLCNSEHKN